MAKPVWSSNYLLVVGLHFLVGGVVKLQFAAKVVQRKCVNGSLFVLLCWMSDLVISYWIWGEIQTNKFVFTEYFYKIGGLNIHVPFPIASKSSVAWDYCCMNFHPNTNIAYLKSISVRRAYCINERVSLYGCECSEIHTTGPPLIVSLSCMQL